jgi:hypothetical protein
LQKLISSEEYEENNFWSFCLFVFVKKEGENIRTTIHGGEFNWAFS